MREVEQLKADSKLVDTASGKALLRRIAARISQQAVLFLGYRGLDVTCSPAASSSSWHCAGSHMPMKLY